MPPLNWKKRKLMITEWYLVTITMTIKKFYQQIQAIINMVGRLMKKYTERHIHIQNKDNTNV